MKKVKEVLVMAEHTSNENNQTNVKTDRICIDKMNFKVIHYSPKKDPENFKTIEKQLYKIFKKYENSAKNP